MDVDGYSCCIHVRMLVAKRDPTKRRRVRSATGRVKYRALLCARSFPGLSPSATLVLISVHGTYLLTTLTRVGISFAVKLSCVVAG